MQDYMRLLGSDPRHEGGTTRIGYEQVPGLLVGVACHLHAAADP